MGFRTAMAHTKKKKDTPNEKQLPNCGPIPLEHYDAVVAAAADENRSLGGQQRQIFKEWFETRTKAKAKG